MEAREKTMNTENNSLNPYFLTNINHSIRQKNYTPVSENYFL